MIEEFEQDRSQDRDMEQGQETQDRSQDQIPVFEPGELFVYQNGDRFELGMVKSRNRMNDGYFCWYSIGSTAANTPIRCMRKFENNGFTKIEQLLEDMRETVRELYADLAVADPGTAKARWLSSATLRSTLKGCEAVI